MGETCAGRRARPLLAASPMTNANVPVILSALWTGLGQAYAGQRGRGVLLMGATALLWALAVEAPWVAAPLAGWWLWGVLDTRRVCLLREVGLL